MPLPPEVSDWRRKESLKTDSQWASTPLPGTGRSILLSAVQVAVRRKRGSYWYQIIADYKSRYSGSSGSLPSFLLPSCFRESHSTTAGASHKSKYYWNTWSIGEGQHWQRAICCRVQGFIASTLRISEDLPDTKCYIMVNYLPPRR